MNKPSALQRERIEAYCEGRLPADEAAQVAAQLAENPDWMAFAESHRALLQGVDAAVEARLKAQLQTHEQAHQQSVPPVEESRSAPFAGRRIGWIILVALALIGLLWSIGIGRRSARQDTPAELFAQYYEVPLNTWMVTTRGAVDTVAVAAAMRLYESGSYAEAARALAALEVPAPEVGFYRGICLLQLKNFEQALPLLREYHKTHPADADAQWYYALGLVAVGQLAEARVVLEGSVWTGAAQARADQLLRELVRE